MHGLVSFIELLNFNGSVHLGGCGSTDEQRNLEACFRELFGIVDHLVE